jgi:hypothetical protein
MLLAGFFLTGCEKPKEPLLVTNETNNLSAQQLNDEADLTPISNAPEDDNFLTNVRWKLVAFVDVANSKSKTPAPEGDNCYWLEFYDNDSLSGWSSTNLLFGSYIVDSKQSSITVTELGGTKVNELFDGYLYFESLHAIESYSLSGDSLALYYNSKQNYLLFERM